MDIYLDILEILSYVSCSLYISIIREYTEVELVYSLV